MMLINRFFALLVVLALAACGGGGGGNAQSGGGQPGMESFTLTYQADAGGSIDGTASQTVAKGGSGSEVIAVPSAGHVFDKWSDNLTTPSRTDADVQGNITVIAQFKPLFELTYQAGTGGSIAGDNPQQVARGDNAQSVTAVPDEGYVFSRWSDGKTEPTRIDKDVQASNTITAEFELADTATTYTLTYSPGPNGTLVGQLEQSVKEGNSGSTVTAVPEEGYAFIRWSDGNPDAARTDANVTEDGHFTAEFALRKHTVTYVAGAGGYLTGTTVQQVNYNGYTSDVSAVPNDGFLFVKWSEDNSTQNHRNDGPIREDKTYTALFGAAYDLNYTAGAGGSVDGVRFQQLAEGQEGTPVTAKANEGYVFVAWSDNLSTPTRSDIAMANLDVQAQFAPAEVTYTLTYVAGNGGRIDGPGAAVQTVGEGSTGQQVTAVANAGYVFVGWSDDVEGAQRVDENVHRDITATAEFARAYTLNYAAGTGGSVQGDAQQTVREGENGSMVTAIPAAGYEFVKWSDNNANAARTDNDVQADLNVSAEFRIKQYSLTYTAGAGGSITGESNQTINHGADGQAVTATANAGYLFVRWSDESLSAIRQHKAVTENISVTAEFVQGYTVQYNTSGSGSISGTATQLIAPNGNGTAVTAVPAAGYVFVRWSDGSTSPTHMATNVTSSVTLTALFEVPVVPTFQLQYSAGAGGTLSGEATQTVSQGGNGSAVIAVPNTGYEFVKWSDNKTAASRTDSNVQANLTVAAQFKKKSYTVTYAESVGGTVSGDKTQTIEHGSNGTTVTAIPNEGYEFDKWSDGVSAMARTPTNVQGNVAVIAQFKRKQYTVTYVADTGGTVQGNKTQTIEHGSNGTTVTAIPNEGYEFDKWSDDVTTASRTATNVQGNIAVTAQFRIKRYAVTYVAGDNGRVNGNLTQNVPHGASGTEVTAQPKIGYQLDRWSDGSTALTHIASNVRSELNITALFKPAEYTLTYAATLGGSITVGSPNQIVRYGEDGEQVRATAKPNYRFVGWSDGKTENLRIETNVKENFHVTANFELENVQPWISQLHNGSIQLTGKTRKTATLDWNASGASVFDLYVTLNKSLNITTAASDPDTVQFNGLTPPYTVEHAMLAKNKPVYVAVMNKITGDLEWSSFNSGEWVLGSPTQGVADQLKVNGVRYIGGSFSSAKISSGSGGAALFSLQGGDTPHALAFPNLFSRVTAAVSDGDGGWFVAGYRGLHRRHGVSAATRIYDVARVDKHGTVTLNWGRLVPDVFEDGDAVGGFAEINALARDASGRLYIGGSRYTEWAEGGSFYQRAPAVAVIVANGSTEATGRSLYFPGSGSSVVGLHTMAGGKVYVAGGFAHGACYDLIEITVASGAVNTGFCPFNAFQHTKATAVNGTDIYVATMSGGVTAINKVATTSGTVSTFASDIQGEVNSLSIDSFLGSVRAVYAGGDFTVSRAGVPQHANLAMYNGSGVLQPSLMTVANVKAVQARANGDLFVAGDFSKVTPRTGGAVDRPGFAVVTATGTNAGALKPMTLSTISPSTSVLGMVTFNNDLLVLGDFFALGAGLTQKTVKGLAAMDEDGELLDAPYIDGEVDVLTHHGNRLYVGGLFNKAGDFGQQDASSLIIRNNIAAFDLTSGQLLSWAPYLMDRVQSIAVATTGDVYVAGRFARAAPSGQGYEESVQRMKLAAFNSAGALLPWAPFVNDPDRNVSFGGRAIAIDDTGITLNGEHGRVIYVGCRSWGRDAAPCYVWYPGQPITYNTYLLALNEAGGVVRNLCPADGYRSDQHQGVSALQIHNGKLHVAGRFQCGEAPNNFIDYVVYDMQTVSLNTERSRKLSAGDGYLSMLVTDDFTALGTAQGIFNFVRLYTPDEKAVDFDLGVYHKTDIAMNTHGPGVRSLFAEKIPGENNHQFYIGIQQLPDAFGAPQGVRRGSILSSTTEDIKALGSSRLWSH